MGIWKWIFKDVPQESSIETSKAVSKNTSTHIICKPDSLGQTKCKKISTETIKHSDRPWEEMTTEEDVSYDSIDSYVSHNLDDIIYEPARPRKFHSFFNMNPYSPWADDSEMPYWENHDFWHTSEDYENSRTRGNSYVGLHDIDDLSGDKEKSDVYEI